MSNTCRQHKSIVNKGFPLKAQVQPMLNFAVASREKVKKKQWSAVAAENENRQN